jgi:very-short-patch-repair endonuclease
MDGENGSRWSQVAELAGKQHGVSALWQLFRLGLPRGWIEHQIRSGRLHRVFRGVYAVGHASVSVQGRALAAVLACGQDAVLSHWAAAAHWDLLATSRTVIDVVVLGNRVGQKGIKVHCVRQLDRTERTIRDQIPITTVPRTLLDLAAVATERQLRRATNEATRQGWLNSKVVNELCARHPGRSGIKPFKAVIAAVNPGTRRTRSDLEDDFLTLCRHEKLPTPNVNTKVEGVEVDIHFPGTRLIVELDSYEYHRTPQEFDNDRRRDAYLKTKGYEVLRVSDQWLNTNPRGVAITVRQLLAATR